MPTHTQLCSTGFAGGFSVTAFRSRFTVLRISRDRGDRASPLHLEERNCTSTGPKLSKTSSVHVPHPWRMRHFEGTDRSFPLYVAFPRSEYYAHTATPSGLGVSPSVSAQLRSTRLPLPLGASHVHDLRLLRRPVGGGYPISLPLFAAPQRARG